MTSVQQFILAIDNDPAEARRIAQDVSEQLKAQKVTLIAVVESLGEYINSDSDSTRSKAVKFLIQVFESLPDNFLSRQQIHVICHFLCDRVEDDGAIHGLTVLASLARFTSEMAVLTFRALMGLMQPSIHVHFSDLQALPQPKRFEIISLLNLLMVNHRKALRSLGDESLLALVDLFASERDPRNLMVVFSVFRVLISEWETGEHAEVLFDSVFCYFPITFQPPPNDPYGITAEDLKQRLKDCISASQAFAPFAFPQLINKFDVDSLNAKRDVLHTIAACASSYSSQTVSNYSITIWDALKFEVFNAQEEELSQLALSDLQAIARRLGSDEEYLAIYLRSIANECNEKLREPHHKQAQPAAAIIGSLSSTSLHALSFFAKSCLPALFEIYRDAQNFETRRATLDAISKILRGATGVQNLSNGTKSPLLEYKDQLFQMSSEALMSASNNETAFRLAALQCLLLSCKCPQLLDNSEVGMVIQYLDDIILTDVQDMKPILKNEAIESLSEVSRIYPELVVEIAIPAFLAKLPDSGTPSKAVYHILESAAGLKFDKALSSTLSRRLFNKAKILARNTHTSQYVRAVLASTYLILDQHDLGSDLSLSSHLESLVELIQSPLHKCPESAIESPQQDYQLTVMIGRLLSKILRAMNIQDQQSSSLQLFTILEDSMKSETTLTRTPLPLSRARILLTYTMASLKKSIQLPYSEEQLLVMLHQLTVVVQEERNSVARLNTLQQIALIVNKFLRPQSLVQVEQDLWSGFLMPGKMTSSSIRVGFWILKGLLFRLVKIDTILDQLLNQASDSEHGLDIGLGFEWLLQPDEILSKENGAVIRLLSSQKIFDLCLAGVTTRLHAIPAETKSHYIIALSGLLKYLGPDIITPRADALLPLLLQAFDVSRPGVKEAAIQTITTLIKTSSESVETHASSLISRLLKAAGSEGNDMVNVRHAALVCLELFPSSFKSTTLIPYRQAALKGILQVLDDPRRQVRKTAVDCRTAWLNLDEPDEPEH